MGVRECIVGGVELFMYKRVPCMKGINVGAWPISLLDRLE